MADHHDPKWNAILLFGMPGSGKGTQGRALGSVPGFLHVATGDIFRQLNRVGPLGREVDGYISNGKLVPDELTLRIFLNHMKLLQKQKEFDPGWQTPILDGIPRTFPQAELLDREIRVRRIYFLKLHDEDEAVRRIRSRALKEGRTDDADEGIIRDRLVTYHRQTASTLAFYPPDLVLEIDAARPAIQVLHTLVADLCQLPCTPR
jgi:adenylate kinase